MVELKKIHESRVVHGDENKYIPSANSPVILQLKTNPATKRIPLQEIKQIDPSANNSIAKSNIKKTRKYIYIDVSILNLT
jgi:hypothetical protein